METGEWGTCSRCGVSHTWTVNGWCGYCRTEATALADAARELEGKDYIYICTGDTCREVV